MKRLKITVSGLLLRSMIRLQESKISTPMVLIMKKPGPKSRNCREQHQQTGKS